MTRSYLITASKFLSPLVPFLYSFVRQKVSLGLSLVQELFYVMAILNPVTLSTFPNVLTKRIYIKIKSFLNW